MEALNLIGMYPNVARAMEIAMTGGFGIYLYGDVPQEELNAVTRWLENNQVRCTISQQNALCVELTRVDWRRLFSSGKSETIDDIRRRVGQAKIYVTPKDPDETALLLVKQAYEKLQASWTMIDFCIPVARIIALLDNAVKVRSEHMAEAIQYTMYEPAKPVTFNIIEP